MKKILVLLIVMLYVLSGCAAPSGDAPTTSTEAKTQTGSNTEPTTTAAAPAQKPVFVTTLFPQYDFARTIAGDLADVVLIIPPGVEAHSYEPTPQDIITMDKALAVFFTNPEMEPWMERVASSLNSFVFDLSLYIKLREHDH
ncbi:MAG: metal ABC transporter substrate-binding protein, partial [Bacillota bacterium]|nr:metal ABC transporter substrate-binding protein [Bacillota bacterium]